jgi:hypothetical protein
MVLNRRRLQPKMFDTLGVQPAFSHRTSSHTPGLPKTSGHQNRALTVLSPIATPEFPTTGLISARCLASNTRVDSRRMPPHLARGVGCGDRQGWAARRAGPRHTRMRRPTLTLACNVKVPRPVFGEMTVFHDFLLHFCICNILQYDT